MPPGAKADWRGLKPHRARAGILYRISITLIRERLSSFSRRCSAATTASRITETRALAASAAGTFQFFAAACETLEEQITPSRGDFVTMSIGTRWE